VTYIELAAWFVGAAALLGIALTFASRGRRPHLGALALTALILFVLTAVFDTIMIATGLFHFSPAHLLGVFLGLAPLEDFGYPLAGVLLLPSLWVALRARRATRAARTEGRKGER
jgi:lycopene cyclase domain-containing protein